MIYMLYIKLETHKSSSFSLSHCTTYVCITALCVFCMYILLFRLLFQAFRLEMAEATLDNKDGVWECRCSGDCAVCRGPEIPPGLSEVLCPNTPDEGTVCTAHVRHIHSSTYIYACLHITVCMHVCTYVTRIVPRELEIWYKCGMNKQNIRIIHSKIV